MSLMAFVTLGFTMTTYANSVLLAANQPVKITYRIAHKNENGPTIFEEPQVVDLNTNARIAVDMNNYDKAGLVIVAANEHELPSTVNQFDQPMQCSMTFDKTKSTGALEFELTPHRFTCRTYGGVFG